MRFVKILEEEFRLMINWIFSLTKIKKTKKICLEIFLLDFDFDFNIRGFFLSKFLPNYFVLLFFDFPFIYNGGLFISFFLWPFIHLKQKAPFPSILFLPFFSTLPDLSDGRKSIVSLWIMQFLLGETKSLIFLFWNFLIDFAPLLEYFALFA